MPSTNAPNNPASIIDALVRNTSYKFICSIIASVALYGCDRDNDGYSRRTGDCDDARADVAPNQIENCDDIDNDCDGNVDEGSFDDESCDGIDNDCDDIIDEGPFDDEGCDGIDNDCDDIVDEGPFDDEGCDGIDNDCDDIVDEDTFMFISSAGVATIFSPGTMENPSQIEIVEDGKLNVCESVYANIDINGCTVDIIGTSESPSIDGAALGSVVHISGGSNVKISGVTISNGQADACAFHESQPTWFSGGGICCESSSLELNSLMLTNNSALTGGGLFSRDCDITVSATTFSSNESVHYGGGLVVIDGSAEVTNSSFRANNADPFGGSGGAFFVGRTAESVDNPFLFRDTEITENYALLGGGGFVGSRTSVRCIGSDGVGGFTRNRATTGGGALLLAGSTSFIESAGCSWGVGDSNNYSESGATDIGSDELQEDTKDFGENETFICSNTVCPQ